MVHSCCVIGCKAKSHDRKGNKYENKLRFFRFPTWKRKHGEQIEEISKRRRMAWVTALGREDITFTTASPFLRVCSRHFHSGQPAYEMHQASPDWAPSLHLRDTPGQPLRTGRRCKWEKMQKEADIKEQQAMESPSDPAEEQQTEEVKIETEEFAIKVEMHQTSLDGQPAYEMHQASPDWAPSLHLRDTPGQPLRTGRPCKWEKMQKEADIKEQQAMESPSDPAEEKQTEEVKIETEEFAIKVEMHQFSLDAAQTECDQCVLQRAEVNRLMEENRELQRELNELRISDGFFGEDDDKVKYYTGLPNLATFTALFHFLLPLMPSEKKSLTPFQMLLLTFMRLRLDLPAQHLAHMFHVSPNTVCRTFNEMVSFLYVNLSRLIVWPDKDTLYKTMPGPFAEAFGRRAAVIIDSFEISTEKPSNLKARVQMFSSYKHKHTMKYLVGVTPRGAICFLSKGWGGCTSDKHITLNSGFLDHLLPGDIVLADRGFGFQEHVGMLCAEVKAPAFTKGQCQLAAKDAEETGKIAHLRLHVERVTGNVCEKYKILTGAIPVNMIIPCEGEDATMLDKIVSVCCALTNHCPAVV